MFGFSGILVALKNVSVPSKIIVGACQDMTDGEGRLSGKQQLKAIEGFLRVNLEPLDCSKT